MCSGCPACPVCPGCVMCMVGASPPHGPTNQPSSSRPACRYWFNDTAPAVNGYEHVLDPATQKCDVTYWLNQEAVRRGRQDLFTINTAVEATSLNDRACCRLLPQDTFIRRHIKSQDYLIVSIGGNDLALAPVLATILNIIPLLCCTPTSMIETGVACPPNTHVDCGCFGCGLPGCAVSAFGCPPGLAYFGAPFQSCPP